MPIPFFYSYGGLFIHLTNTFEHLLCSRPWRRCRVPSSSGLYRGVSQIVPVTPQHQNKIWNPYPWFLVLPEMTIWLLTENILKTSRKSWHGIDYLGSVYTSLREWLLSWKKNTNLFEVLLSPKYWCCMDFSSFLLLTSIWPTIQEYSIFFYDKVVSSTAVICLYYKKCLFILIMTLWSQQDSYYNYPYFA